MRKKIFVPLIIILSVYFFYEQKEEAAVDENQDVVIEEVKKEILIDEKPERVTQPVAAPPLKVKKPKINKRRAKYPNLDESFALFDEEGNQLIVQVVKVGKHLVYHGDMLVGDEKDLEKIKAKKIIRKGKAEKWPGGKVPYVIDSSVPNESTVLEAIDYLNEATNIQIVPRTNEKDYVFIARGEGDCYSYAGKIGGKQEIYLTQGCGLRQIVHEWMHTIGFLHEQNREDRDQYVKVIWDNIEELHHPQFKKLPNHFMGISGRPFDYNSVMLYHSMIFSAVPGEPALLTSDGDLIPVSQGLLSEEDVNRVNLAYPL